MLILFLQNDEWGKKGKDSIVAQLWSKTPGSPGIDESKHYSEVYFRRHQLLDRMRELMDVIDVDGHLSIESILPLVYGGTAG